MDGLKQWKRVDDLNHAECSYRFTDDGQVEVLAFGAHVLVPIKALPLLPESIARAVLGELAERAAIELRAAAAKPTPAEEES